MMGVNGRDPDPDPDPDRDWEWSDYVEIDPSGRYGRVTHSTST